VGDKKLKEGKVEVKIRRTGERTDVKLGDLVARLKEIFGSV
jgi:prolyl-tRNA synthetase